MFSRSSSATTPPRAWRLTAMAALIAAALASPGFAAAQSSSPAMSPSAPTQSSPMHHHTMAGHHWAMTRETVEARISSLHTRLGITLDEEAKWAAVAQVMRDNEADMQRMIAERHSAAPHDVTAVEDLKTYEHFTQAHVNGLKNLISSFEVLYSAMPASQQAVADRVFVHFGNRAHALNS